MNVSTAAPASRSARSRRSSPMTRCPSNGLATPRRTRNSSARKAAGHTHVLVKGGCFGSCPSCLTSRHAAAIIARRYIRDSLLLTGRTRWLRCHLSQRYVIFFLCFVFALAERKNETQIQWQVPCCRRLKDVCVRHRVRPVIYCWFFFRPAGRKKKNNRREESAAAIQSVFEEQCCQLPIGDYGPSCGVIVLTTSLTSTFSPGLRPLVSSTDSLLLRPIVTGRLSFA